MIVSNLYFSLEELKSSTKIQTFNIMTVCNKFPIYIRNYSEFCTIFKVKAKIV